MDSLKKALPWMLWMWLTAVILGAFLYAPAAVGFRGSSRILFFHVPMAWVSFLAFLTAGVQSLRYLYGGRDRRLDRSAAAAVELGLAFGVLATVTGAMWAKVMWGAYWNWDPRQPGRRLCRARPGGGAVPLLRDASHGRVHPPPRAGGQHRGQGGHGRQDGFGAHGQPGRLHRVVLLDAQPLLPDPGSHGPDDALSGVIGTMNSSGGVADVGNINLWILG